MPYIDIMDVKMTKQKEDFYYIWYKFEFNVEDGTYLSKSRKERTKFTPHYGIIKFSKNCFNKELKEPQDPFVEIIEEGTDQIYLDIDEEQSNRIMRTCLSAVYNFKKTAQFPDYASRQIG